jgi:hypothetical protein
LPDREWQIWDLHCRGNSQCRITTRLGINQSGGSRSLRSIELKITAARERVLESAVRDCSGLLSSAFARIQSD